MAEQRYTEAMTQLEKALRYDPIYAPLYRLLGIACRRSGAIGRATSFLNKALVFDPADQAARYHLAMVAAEADQEEQAFEQLRLAWICPPAADAPVCGPLVALELARRFEDAGYLTAAEQLYAEFETARATWKESDLSDPDQIDFISTGPEFASLRIGRINERLGRLERASDAYERARKYAPDDVVVRTGSARLLMRMGRPAEARVLTRRLLAAASDDREWEEVCTLYDFAGRQDDLLEDLRILAAETEPPVRVLEALFDATRSKPDATQAEPVLSKLIKTKGDDSSTYVRAIEFYAAQGRGRRAVQVLADVLADHPERLGLLEEAMNQVSLSETGAAALLGSVDPTPAERSPLGAHYAAVHYLLAGLALRLGEQAQAQSRLEALIRRNPGFAPAYALLGELRVRHARWQDAIDLILPRVKEDGELVTDPQAHLVLGRAYDGLDDYEKAESALERAAALRRDDTEALYLLGRLLERRGDTLRARRQYQAVLSLQPHHEQAHEALVRNFLFYQGELRLAQDQLHQMKQEAGPSAALERCQALWEFYEQASASRRSRREAARNYTAKLQTLAEQDSSDVQTRLDLALALCTQLREYDRAARVIDEALEVDPDNPHGLELRVLIHRRKLEFEQAADLLSRMLERHPNREPWMEQLFQVQLTLQEYDQAVSIILRMIARPDSRFDPRQLRVLLLDAHVLAGRYTEAIETVRAWETQKEATTDEQRASSPSWRYQLILRLLHAGATDLALKQAEEWYASSPADPYARAVLLYGLVPPLTPEIMPRPTPPIDSWRGVLFAEPAEERIERAKRLLFEWFEEDPASSALHYRIIGLLSLQDKVGGAVELARNWHAGSERARHQWDQWSEYDVLAKTLLDARKYDEAIRMYKQRARATNDTDHFRLAVLAMTQARRFEQAERYLLNLQERARSSLEQRTRIASWLYQCYLAWDKSIRAEEQLQQMLEDLEELSYVPESEEAERYFGTCNDLGYFWADQGRNLERAEEMIRLAVSRAPRRSAYLDSLGWVRYKRGDLDSALKWLMRGARAGGFHDPVILEHLGDTHWRLGRRERAVESWRRALSLLKARAARGDLSPDEARSRRAVKTRLERIERGEEPQVAETAGDPPAA